MHITIDATADEIAALTLRLQERQKPEPVNKPAFAPTHGRDPYAETVSSGTLIHNMPEGVEVRAPGD